MGFRMRKSINLGGGFRINLSKSGVGYSWGVPGYRITKTAKGNTRRTYSIPGTGLSYVDETSGKGNHKNDNGFNQEVYQDTTIMEDIESADIENYQPIEYKDFIARVSKIISINRLANWLCYSIVLLPIGIALKIFIQLNGKIELDYEMDDFYHKRYRNTLDAWNNLNKSLGLWQIIQQGNVINRKVNAGATSLVNRKTFKIVNEPPFYLKSETQIIQLKLYKETLIFLPDKVLVIKGSKIGVVNYDDIIINVDSTRFIEDSKVLKDAIVIDYTWEKVNKNGTPDKRYKNNRQLPICKYGVISINSSSGLNIVLHSSSLDNTSKFNELMLNQ